MITNFSRETTLKQRNTEQENSNSDTQNVFYFHAMSYFSRKQLELTMRHSGKIKKERKTESWITDSFFFLGWSKKQNQILH